MRLRDAGQVGARLELDVKFMLEREPDPWFCMRSAGSQGLVDVIAMWHDQTLLIQCKKRTSLSSVAKEAELIAKAAALWKTPCLAYRDMIEGLTRKGKYSSAVTVMNLLNKEKIYIWPLTAIRGLQKLEREEKKIRKQGALK